MTTDLLDLPHDPLLDEGAKNAIYTCLDIQPDERVALITDRDTMEVAAALAAQLAEAASHVDVVILEDVADRPVTHLPLPMGNALEQADVSIFAATALPGELAMRRAMTDIVSAGRMRHGHMVGITEQIMKEGHARAISTKIDEADQAGFDGPHRRRRDEITCDDAGWHGLARDIRPRRSAGSIRAGMITKREVGQPARRRDVHRSGARGRGLRRGRRVGQLDGAQAR